MNHKKKSHKIKNNNSDIGSGHNSNSNKNINGKRNTIIHPSKLMSTQVHDEDIELEDKSIALLNTQRHPMRSFTFGHNKVKTFDIQKNYAKQLTKKTQKPQRKCTSVLENDQMMVDLIDSLPK